MFVWGKTITQWLLLGVTLAAGAGAAGDAPLIGKIEAQPDGHIRVVLDSAPARPGVIIPKEPSQVATRALAVAPDRRSAGWLVEVPNCCTSYPVPTTLILYRGGLPLLRLATGQAIWGWRYHAGGRQVAFYAGPTHGEDIRNYQLCEVRSGRLIDNWMGRPGDARAPAWTRALE